MLFRKGDLVKAFIFLMLIEVLTAFGTLIYLATSVNSMPNWGLGLTMSVTFFVVMVDCILGILIFKAEGIKEIGTIKVFEEDLQIQQICLVQYLQNQTKLLTMKLT